MSAIRRVFRGTYRIFWLSWLVMTAALVCYVIKEIPPSYEAMAILHVEPNTSPILFPDRMSKDIDSFMETQIQLLTSSDVISLALKNPKVAALRWVRESSDPEALLKTRIRVRIPPRSHVLLVSLTTSSPTDGALIVNSVVDAYADISASLVDSSTRKLIMQYMDAARRFEGDVNRLRQELITLKSKTANPDPRINPAMAAREDYNRFRERRSQLEMERIETEAVLRVIAEETQTEDHLDKTATAETSSEQQTLQRTLSILKEKEKQLTKRLDSIEVESLNAADDDLQAEFLKADLERSTESLRRVAAMLSSLELESSGQASVSNVSPAKPSVAPTSDSRPVWLAAAPLVSFVVMIGLFTLGDFLNNPPPRLEEPETAS